MTAERAKFRLRLHLLPILIMGAIILWAGLPVLTHTFGYNDDYHLLLRARGGHLNGWRNEFTEGGRYLLSPLIVTAYRLADEVSGLAAIRAVALGGLITFALSVYLILVQARGSRLSAMAAALLTTLTPASAVWLGWGACFIYPLVASLALLSGRWAWSLCSEGGFKGKTIVQIAANVLVIVICCALYQPNAAFWIVGFWFGSWLTSHDPARPHLRMSSGKPVILPLIVGIGLFLCGSAAYFLVFKLVGSLADFQGQISRGDFAIWKLPGKLLWLGQNYYPIVLASWASIHSVQALHIFAILGGFWAIAALILRHRHTSIRSWVLGSMLSASMMVFAVLPVLASADRMIAFRVMGPLFVTVIFLKGEGLRLFASLLPPRFVKWATASTLLLMLMWALANVYQFKNYMNRGIIEPSSHEFAAIREQVFERVDEFPPVLLYRFPPEDVGDREGFRYFAEYGPYSSFQKWVIPAFLQLILEEKFGHGHPWVQVRSFPESGDLREIPTISAIEAISGPPLETRTDPFWGPIMVYQNGWIDCPWFGVLNNKGFPNIKHSEHYYLHCEPTIKEGDTHWFFDYQTQRWFSTTPKSYPELIFSDPEQTMIFQTIIQPLRRFHDPEKDEWKVHF